MEIITECPELTINPTHKITRSNLSLKRPKIDTPKPAVQVNALTTNKGVKRGDRFPSYAFENAHESIYTPMRNQKGKHSKIDKFPREYFLKFIFC